MELPIADAVRRYVVVDEAWALLSKLVGLTLTAVAISFGAPFWFDTLSKLGRLRSGGAPPPASAPRG